MNKLKEDLDTAHKKLRKVMKDLDRKKAENKLDDDGNPGVFLEPEDELINELVTFSGFLKANQEALQQIEVDV